MNAYYPMWLRTRLSLEASSTPLQETKLFRNQNCWKNSYFTKVILKICIRSDFPGKEKMPEEFRYHL